MHVYKVLHVLKSAVFTRNESVSVKRGMLMCECLPVLNEEID